MYFFHSCNCLSWLWTLTQVTLSISIITRLWIPSEPNMDIWCFSWFTSYVTTCTPSPPSHFHLPDRCRNSVKHYRVIWDGRQFCFGLGKFPDVETLIEHFDNQPIISGDSGTCTYTDTPTTNWRLCTYRSNPYVAVPGRNGTSFHCSFGRTTVFEAL